MSGGLSVAWPTSLFLTDEGLSLIRFCWLALGLNRCFNVDIKLTLIVSANRRLLKHRVMPENTLLDNYQQIIDTNRDYFERSIFDSFQTADLLP